MGKVKDESLRYSNSVDDVVTKKMCRGICSKAYFCPAKREFMAYEVGPRLICFK